ncbi:DUF1850 domain-containing protein [Dongia sp.]|uniref:DUF1850 domain-containing protein n=1 Tax=Dongia sp. TaxID=1977262 RepID=UPI00375122CC
MSLCLLLDGAKIVYATSAFTLGWTHSVEKTRWEEDWRVTPNGLEILEARIEGSGAGMEVPNGARFDGRYWRYHPDLAPQPSLVLARSGMTAGDWQICFAGSCRDLPETPGSAQSPAVLSACP